jgi:hypothetical protein
MEGEIGEIIESLESGVVGLSADSGAGDEDE